MTTATQRRIMCSLFGHKLTGPEVVKTGGEGMIARLRASQSYKHIYTCRICGYQIIENGWHNAADPKRIVTPDEAVRIMGND